MLKEFKKHLESRGMSENTIESYVRAVKQLQQYLTKNLEKATKQDIDDYIWHLRRSGQKHTTINLKLNGIKRFYRWVHLNKGLKGDTEKILAIELLSTREKDREIITEEEVKKMINKIEHSREEAIIATLYSCGLRVSELVGLNKKNFIERDDYVVVRVIDSKNRKDRQTYMNYEYYKYVHDYMYSHENRSGAVFISKKEHYEKKRLTYRYVIKIVKRITKKHYGKELTPHDFRASCFTHLYREGVDIYTIAEFAGHSSIETTKNYIKADEKDVAGKALKAFK